jgi:hypothetical protein
LIDIDRAQVSLNVYELAYSLDLKTPIDYADFLHRRSASEKDSRRLGLDETRSLLSNADLKRLRNRFEASNHRLMTALGRNNSALLRLDVSSDSNSYCDLKEFYTSESYARYREVADAIYTRRNRRHRLKALFKR